MQQMCGIFYGRCEDCGVLRGGWRLWLQIIYVLLFNTSAANANLGVLFSFCFTLSSSKCCSLQMILISKFHIVMLRNPSGPG